MFLHHVAQKLAEHLVVLDLDPARVSNFDS